MNKFIREASWLRGEHAPAVTQLRHLAKALDEQPFEPRLHQQYGTVYRGLLKQRPADEPMSGESAPEDPAERLLAGV